MLESTIVNAKITDTFFGIEDHGIMTFMLYLRFDNYNQGYGGYALDQQRLNGTRVGCGVGITVVRKILETIGVHKWEDLPGCFVRVKRTGQKIEALGNIMEDKWVSLEQIFKEELK